MKLPHWIVLIAATVAGALQAYQAEGGPDIKVHGYSVIMIVGVIVALVLPSALPKKGGDGKGSSSGGGGSGSSDAKTPPAAMRETFEPYRWSSPDEEPTRRDSKTVKRIPVFQAIAFPMCGLLVALFACNSVPAPTPKTPSQQLVDGEQLFACVAADVLQGKPLATIALDCASGEEAVAADVIADLWALFQKAPPDAGVAPPLPVPPAIAIYLKDVKVQASVAKRYPALGALGAVH